MRRGRRAEDEFVRRNVGLVYKYSRRFIGRGLDLDDVQQAGFVGLLTAVRKFDPDRGFKFSTMATWWIRQGMQREIQNTGSAVRLPAWQHQNLADRSDLRELAGPLRSLDAPVSDQGSPLGEFLVSEEVSIESQVLRAEALAELNLLLDEVLTEAERTAIVRRHDPDQGGLSTPQVYQATKAIKKLKADDRARQIFSTLAAA